MNQCFIRNMQTYLEIVHHTFLFLSQSSRNKYYLNNCLLLFNVSMPVIPFNFMSNAIPVDNMADPAR